MAPPLLLLHERFDDSAEGMTLASRPGMRVASNLTDQAYGIEATTSGTGRGLTGPYEPGFWACLHNFAAKQS